MDWKNLSFRKFKQNGTEIAVNMALVAYIAPNGDEKSSVLYFTVWCEGEPMYLVVDETIEEIGQ